MHAISGDVLIHHGILGMKWGVRRFQDSSGSLTSAGKKRYSKSIEDAQNKVAKTKKEYKKSIFDSSSTKSMDKKRLDYRYAKEDLKNEKILEKINRKEKSKTQIQLESSYKNKGYNDEEATVKAYKNIQTRKLLAAVGGMTLVAAASYAAYKYQRENVDKLLKKGTLLQNISDDSTSEIRDAFYSAKNSLDKTKYKGFYGYRLSQTSGGAYSKSIKTLSDINMASPKTARNILQDLLNNDQDFATGIKEYITPEKSRLSVSIYGAKTKKAMEELHKGLVDKNVYEVFNANLADHSPSMQKLTDRFYEALSKNGYNAIRDINDSKYSGYKTLNPIIAFNTSGKVSVVDVKKLTEKEIIKSYNKSVDQITLPSKIISGARIVLALGATQVASKTIKNKISDNAVKKYKEEHPNSELSNTEIKRMLERQT